MDDGFLAHKIVLLLLQLDEVFLAHKIILLLLQLDEVFLWSVNLPSTLSNSVWTILNSDVSHPWVYVIYLVFLYVGLHSVAWRGVFAR
ncbi:unnamed protein product, partial [Timema podura]|nr:unnamed protein product [Timema podura]